MDRRKFLKIATPLSVTPFVVNGFNMTPFANAVLAKMINCDGVNDRVLVVIQLGGGNDGINNIIPIQQYDTYANLRPNIRVPDTGARKYIDLDTTMKIQHQVGLHPGMVEIKEMYDNGLVNIVQGVGYEQPNQSHFKSTDLWLTGGDGTPDNFNIHSGWIGRALQAIYPDIAGFPTTEMPDPLGIQVGDSTPSLGFHTETEHQNSINLSGQDPAGFYSLIQTIGGAPILNIPDSEYGDELAYIMNVEQSVNAYSQRITQVFNAGTNLGTYPANSQLSAQLKTIARLIRGGCKTKIYLAKVGGFDNHDTQVMAGGDGTEGNHEPLLMDLAQSVKAFMDDLAAMGIDEQVMAVTFSEFGRCAKENGSNGTDHGTLAPMYVFGKGVLPGVSGTNVNLSNLTSDNQLTNMQFDYRQVFATLLQDWLGANNYVMEETMFQGYSKIGLVSNSFVVDPACYLGGSVIINDPHRGAGMILTPNPATYFTEINYTTLEAFDATLSLHSMTGQLAKVQQIRVAPGNNTFYMELDAIPAGTYIIRLEGRTANVQEVRKLVKL